MILLSKLLWLCYKFCNLNLKTKSWKIWNSALTPSDEVKQIGHLINTFILRVNFGRDFEKQLQFYDEARGTFMNVDVILVQLVQVLN